MNSNVCRSWKKAPFHPQKWEAFLILLFLPVQEFGVEVGVGEGVGLEVN